MRLVHICLCGPYSDGFTYQENLLSKYHKKNGYDTSIIASKWAWDNKGNIKFIEKSDYLNEHGIRVIRLRNKSNQNINSKFKKFEDLYEKLDELSPDILFIHGSQFIDIKTIVKYLKKHRQIIVYVDNHNDFSNSAKNWISKNILHKIIWRHYTQMINPYVKKFYGVLPSRVDFIRDIYNISENKIELLLMGADDDQIKRVNNSKNSNELKKELNIKKDELVIITGGKIDKYKLEIFNLISIFNLEEFKNLRLIIFGSIEEELKESFNEKISKSNNCIYLGWLKTDQIYDFLSIADLAIYPGRHSVLWEETVGMGIPLIVKKWNRTEHVDFGGNCLFLNDGTEEEIKQLILFVLKDRNLEKMKLIANSIEKDKFNYKQIAKISIEEGKL